MGIFDGLKRLKLDKVQPGKILGAVVSTFPGGTELVTRVDTGLKAASTLVDTIKSEAKARGVSPALVAAEKGEAALRAFENAERTKNMLLITGVGAAALIVFLLIRRR